MAYVHVNGGTLDAVSAATISGTVSVKPTGGTVAMLQAGTISSLPAITGTVAVSGGTIGAATLAAGAAHVGQAGGHTHIFDAALTLSTAPYSAGDLLGTLLTCAAARVAGQGVVVLHVTATDLGKQDKALDVVFFDSAPSASTFTDNGALDVADADLPKVVGYVNLGTADYCDFNDNAIATKRSVGLAANPTSGTLWYCAVTRGTPTYGTADVTLRLGLLQD